MQRTLAFCILSALSCAAFAAPAASTPATTVESDAALQRQMTALQARMNALADRMAALSSRMGDAANASALRYLADGKRGMLGIAVSHQRDGMHVDAVTPDGPADRAGLKAGDVITAINNKPLSRSDASWLTGLSDLQPGKPLRLTVRRGETTLHPDVTPARMQDGDWQSVAMAARRAAEAATAEVRSPAFRAQIQQSIDTAMQNAAVAIKNADVARDAAVDAGKDSHAWVISTSPWWGLNLAPLNTDLGRYFGVDEGALVLSRNDQQFPELQAGDVITAVDGKKVGKPEDVQRALRGADADRRVPVTLRRHDKTLTLAMKVPSPGWNLMPPPPPPAPPTPPTPPKPVAPPPPPGSAL